MDRPHAHGPGAGPLLPVPAAPLSGGMTQNDTLSRDDRLAPRPRRPLSGGALDSTSAQRLLRAFFAGRSPATLRAYEGDLRDFAAFCSAPTADAAAAMLLAHGAGPANELALLYKAHLQSRGLAPATANRRLAALRSL